MREYERVVLIVDLPEDGLRAGDIGTVVDLHHSDDCIVEFTTLTGEPIGVIPLSRSSVRAIAAGDMPPAE